MAMTLDKAIEILNGPEPDIDGILNDDYKDAIMLGSEGLKAIKEYRKFPFYSSLKLLPGETEG